MPREDRLKGGTAQPYDGGETGIGWRDRIKQSSAALRQAQDQYDAGMISTLDLLTSEQTLVNADAASASSDSALTQDQIAVFKALGGGWQ